MFLGYNSLLGRWKISAGKHLSVVGRSYILDDPFCCIAYHVQDVHVLSLHDIYSLFYISTCRQIVLLERDVEKLECEFMLLQELCYLLVLYSKVIMPYLLILYCIQAHTHLFVIWEIIFVKRFRCRQRPQKLSTKCVQHMQQIVECKLNLAVYPRLQKNLHKQINIKFSK